MQYTAGSTSKTANQQLSPILSNVSGSNVEILVCFWIKWEILVDAQGFLAENRDDVVAPSLNKVLTSEGIVTTLSVAGIHVSESALKGKSIPQGLKTFV
jgi:hypothetical protein